MKPGDVCLHPLTSNIMLLIGFDECGHRFSFCGLCGGTADNVAVFMRADGKTHRILTCSVGFSVLEESSRDRMARV